MKYLIKILQRNWRKSTTLILLSSFMFTVIFSVYPLSKCNKVCEVRVEVPQCCAQENYESKNTCCDEMHMETKIQLSSSPVGLEISNLKCMLEFSTTSEEEFLIPKTLESNSDLIQIATISLGQNNYLNKHSEQRIEYSLEYGPPIYIKVSSYLI